MAKHSDERNYSKHIASLASFIPLGWSDSALSDTASAQQQQRHQQPPQQFAQVRRTATRVNPPERTNTTPDTCRPVALPSPAIDQTSALGQALAACNRDAAVQETFTLPGLKSDVTLDRCYKGRAYLICVLQLSARRPNLSQAPIGKIVDANYPDLNTVDGVCQLNPETLASNIVGSEDFAKRFKELKSQYDAATNCAGNVERRLKTSHSLT